MCGIEEYIERAGLIHAVVYKVIIVHVGEQEPLMKRSPGYREDRVTVLTVGEIGLYQQLK